MITPPGGWTSDLTSGAGLGGGGGGVALTCAIAGAPSIRAADSGAAESPAAALGGVASAPAGGAAASTGATGAAAGFTGTLTFDSSDGFMAAIQPG
jgi:hypothetical protein